MKTLLRSVAAMFLVFWSVAAQSEEMDVKAIADKIQLLIDAKDLGKAELALDAALNEHPESPELAKPLKSLSVAEMKARRHAQAVQYAARHLERSLVQFNKDPQRTLLVQDAEYLIATAKKGAMNERAVERLDGAIQSIKLRARKESIKEVADEIANQHAQMIRRFVYYLTEIKEFERPQVLLEAELKAARRAYEANREDVGPTVALATLLDAQSGLFERSPPSKEGAARDAAARKELHEFMAARVKERPEEREFLSDYLYYQEVEFLKLVQSDATAAEKALTSIKEYLAQLNEIPRMKSLAKMRYERTVPLFSQRLEAAKAHHEMIGKPAPKLDVETWINGRPLSEKDLSGKVVLLDFWAMWCGPCIDTFPQLIQWHDKHAEKGFVIIGVTQYYGYDWNEAFAEPERTSGLAPELERAALIKVAAHHKVKHRIAVMPEKSELSTVYGAKTFPQAVLIDRAGKVRIIRVGSGGRTAYDLDTAIEQALSEPAPNGDR